MRKSGLFVLLILLPGWLFSQKPIGTPFIQNYSPHKEGVSPENWTIVQDKRGVMFFGNSSGVLEYDGAKTILIPVSNGSMIRSLAVAEDGLIYVGAVGDLGYLSPDDKGKMHYHSLVDKLPVEERQFADVWKTYTSKEGVYFQTFDKLIRFSKAGVKIWRPESSFHFSYFVNERLYIIDRERGLKQLANDELLLMKNGNMFSGMRIYSLLPYSSDRLLAATREKGLFTIDLRSDSVKPIMTSANESLVNDQVYAGVVLDRGRFAFATLKNGLLILNRNGNIIQHVTKRDGLQEDIVKNLYVDAEKDLWLALGKGISRLEVSNPLSFFTEAEGVEGTVQQVISVKDRIYVASSLGVLYSTANRFEHVAGINSQTLALLLFVYHQDSILLAASESGIYQINGAGARLIHEGFGYFLYQSLSDPSRVFIGMNDGLASVRYMNKKWIDEDYFPGVDKEIRSIAEEPGGDLWLGTPFDGVMKLQFLKAGSGNDSMQTKWGSRFEVNSFDTTHGLPDLKYNIPYNFNGEILFATTKGFYKYQGAKNKFYRDTVLGKGFHNGQIFRFVPKDSKQVWMSTVRPDEHKEVGIATLKPDGSLLWYTKPFGKISDREIHAIYPDANGITWLGGPDGLLSYDEKIKKDFSLPFAALIRKVIADRDTLFYGTFYRQKDSVNVPLTEQGDEQRPRIPYFSGSLVFEFTASSFGSEQSTRFSVFLEGFDEGWSDWSDKNSKECNLSAGDYIFHVKAKNIYGAESIEAIYAFTILPPWYLTVWAFVGYALILIGLVYLIIRLSIRRLVKQKERLEGIVKERTAEVVLQKHLIEEKHKEITDSINYAERIQRSFLATKELLDENLKEYFVFFQPKDVVSGDFYWASKLKNGQFAMVTADSTGHGVPGAIMSLLNITSIEKAIEQHSDPAEILTHARKIIIERLKKDGSAEGGKDGMDCSLTCFDIQKMEMSYAAANNPLWIVRDKQIIEYDPDKMPVGKHDRDTIPFSKNTISLQKGDVVFTCTDGMPDQFGGPKGKKFMYKKLKELFVSISDLPMAEQKNKISEALNDWKGELEQVDDVCVIAVRI